MQKHSIIDESHAFWDAVVLPLLAARFPEETAQMAASRGREERDMAGSRTVKPEAPASARITDSVGRERDRFGADLSPAGRHAGRPAPR